METGEQKRAEHCYQDTKIDKNNGSKKLRERASLEEELKELPYGLQPQQVTRVIGGRESVC